MSDIASRHVSELKTGALVVEWECSRNRACFGVEKCTPNVLWLCFDDML